MNLTIANKIGLLSLIMALLILAAGAAGLNGVRSLSSSLDFIMNEAWDTADGAMEGTIELQAELIATEAILTGSLDYDSGMAKIKKAVEGATEALDRMIAAGLIPQGQIDELHVKIKKYREARKKTLDVYHNMSSSESEAASHNQHFIQLEKNLTQVADTLLSFLGELDENGDSKVEGEMAAIEASQSAAYTTVIVVVIIGLLIAVVGYVLSLKMIVQPILEVSENLKKIDENGGDLTHEMSLKGKDEITELTKGFNFFMGSTRKIINHVKETSQQVNSEGEVLSRIIDDTNKGAINQKAEIEQVASAVAELVATIASVSSHAEEASSVSDSAVSSMEDGKTQVQETMKNVQKLATDMDQASSVINTVQSEANNIGSVLEVIRGIAEQTNLLALNAAIEAARAGEQGRGFAVVADEVRTLASRTQESTTEIQAMIDSLQNGSKNAVDVISKSYTQTEESVKSASKASEALNAIVVAISSLSELNQQIAVATREQKIASSTIESNAENIHSVADATADKANTAQSSIMQLVARSNAMSEMVAKFKT